jgi:MoaA/NifB/PqqE/SkfB family radical SAM enzyme/Flp pilus assembly protein TadD
MPTVMTKPTPQSLLTQALAFESQGDWPRMEQAVRALLAQVPDHADGLYALARLAMRAGRFETATDLARRLLAIAPQAAELHRLLGQALANSGRLDDGMEALEHALALRPGWADAALDLAVLLMQAERLDRLLALLAPFDHPAAHALAGQALAYLGRLDEAESRFRQAVEQAPGHADAVMGLARVLIDTDRAADALDLLGGAKDGRSAYLRAVALGLAGREAEAEAETARLRQSMLAELAARGNRPAAVHVQLSRRCNLRCTMCGHAVWKDNSGFMEDAVFDRILEQCRESRIGAMTILAAQGEPFLHPRAFEMMERAVAQGLAVSVVTNGTPFTPERIERLAGLGLAALQFSFAGWDAPSYESVYVGAKFDRAVKTLAAMQAALRPTRTVFSVKAVAPDNSPDYVAKTRAFLEGIGISRINTVAPNNFGGTVQLGRYWEDAGIWSYRDLEKQRRTVCRILMGSVGIYVDGRVTACGCYDSNAELAIGDIMGQSLGEIRKDAPFRHILDAFGTGNLAGIPLCSKCDDPFG